MKKINISNYNVIKAGIKYTMPVTKNLKSFLQNKLHKKEEYVFWLQPKNGRVCDQIACLCINDEFYNLCLQLEKIIFRHIRLNKKFVNIEKLQDGSQKLRIPQRLFKEKQRTSLRSAVIKS